MTVVRALDSLSGKRGLIVYTGQSRLFDSSIKLQVQSFNNYKHMSGLQDLQFDVMLSTWQEDTPESHIQSLSEWHHGETYLKLSSQKVFDHYDPRLKEYNGMKMILGKSLALNYIHDLSKQYDFIILTRTDYHVPCFTLSDVGFLNSLFYSSILFNQTSVFHGQHAFKTNKWYTIIDDNFVVIPTKLIYVLNKNRLTNITTSILQEAFEENKGSGHILMYELLTRIHLNVELTDHAIYFHNFPIEPKLFRSYEQIQPLLLEYSWEIYKNHSN
jgi:hypothetical protein